MGRTAFSGTLRRRDRRRAPPQRQRPARGDQDRRGDRALRPGPRGHRADERTSGSGGRCTTTVAWATTTTMARYHDSPTTSTDGLAPSRGGPGTASAVTHRPLRRTCGYVFVGYGRVGYARVCERTCRRPTDARAPPGPRARAWAPTPPARSAASCAAAAGWPRLLATPARARGLPRPPRPAALRRRPARPDRRRPPRDRRRRDGRHPPRARLARARARAVHPDRHRHRRRAPLARLQPDPPRRRLARGRHPRGLHRHHDQGDPRRQGLHPPRA